MSTICSDASNNSFIYYFKIGIFCEWLWPSMAAMHDNFCDLSRLLDSKILMNFPCMSSIFVTIIDLKWCIDHTALFDLSTQTSRPTWGVLRTLRPPYGTTPHSLYNRQYPILRTEGPPNDASEWHFEEYHQRDATHVFAYVFMPGHIQYVHPGDTRPCPGLPREVMARSPPPTPNTWWNAKVKGSLRKFVWVCGDSNPLHSHFVLKNAIRSCCCFEDKNTLRWCCV